MPHQRTFLSARTHPLKFSIIHKIPSQKPSLSLSLMAASATAAAVRFPVGAHKLSSKSLFNLHSFAPKPRPFAFSKRKLTCKAFQKTELSVREEGKPETLDYSVFFHDSTGKKVSPWHDIPLKLGDGVFNFVVEIPKESSAKMEVATDEAHTPIKQDTKKGKLRYYPYNINWNYGLLPQTWEDPSFANAEVDGAFGDNDPVDVVEIGGARAKIGDVLKVKPLGALAMIDEGELDWKIVVISLDDPKASLVNDVNDVEKHFPGTLTAIRDWFRDYKIPDGKPANKFGLGNKAADKMALPAKAASMQVPQIEKAQPKISKKKKEKKSKNDRNSKISSRNSEDPCQILKYPVTTEHALKELETNNTLVFVVDKRADKKKIRSAVEKLYSIQTKKINTLMRPDGSKKAYVICKSDVSKIFGFV